MINLRERQQQPQQPPQQPQQPPQQHQQPPQQQVQQQQPQQQVQQPHIYHRYTQVQDTQVSQVQDTQVTQVPLRDSQVQDTQVTQVPLQVTRVQDTQVTHVPDTQAQDTQMQDIQVQHTPGLSTGVQSQEPLFATSMDSSFLYGSTFAAATPFAMETNPEDTSLNLSEISTPRLHWRGSRRSSSSTISTPFMKEDYEVLAQDRGHQVLRRVDPSTLKAESSFSGSLPEPLTQTVASTTTTDTSSTTTVATTTPITSTTATTSAATITSSEVDSQFK